MPTELLSLPWQVQLTLASGYAAYALAYAGIRSHHQTVDVAFATLVFGLIATFVTAALLKAGTNEIVAGVLAFVLTIVVGAIWRMWGRTVLREALRRLKVSQADDDPSAWKAMFSQTKYDVSQIAVQLTDGTWLRCDDTRKFANAPFGPCVLGDNGDVILYLSHEDVPDKPSKELTTVIDDKWGYRATYIPSDKIARVSVRHRSR